MIPLATMKPFFRPDDTCLYGKCSQSHFLHNLYHCALSTLENMQLAHKINLAMMPLKTDCQLVHSNASCHNLDIFDAVIGDSTST